MMLQQVLQYTVVLLQSIDDFHLYGSRPSRLAVIESVFAGYAAELPVLPPIFYGITAFETPCRMLLYLISHSQFFSKYPTPRANNQQDGYDLYVF